MEENNSFDLSALPEDQKETFEFLMENMPNFETRQAPRLLRVPNDNVRGRVLGRMKMATERMMSYQNNNEE